jgi:tetratricopeptide (TPR) repeat protein
MKSVLHRLNRLAAAFCLTLALSPAWGAGAETSDESDGPYGPAIDDADPERGIPSPRDLNQDPVATGYMMMEMAVRAERAEAESNFEVALKYYRAIAKAVPDRAVAFSKLCKIYQAVGDLERALEACRTATGLPGNKAQDFLSFASLLLGRSEGKQIPAADIQELDAVFRHLDGQNVKEPSLDLVLCNFGLRLGDPVRVRRCIERLEQELPGDPVTLSHRFSRALLEEDFAKARGILENAQQLNLPADALNLMENELRSREGSVRARLGIKALSVLALLGVVFWAAVALARKRRAAATA